MAQGLGDMMMLTDLPRASRQQGKDQTCFATSPHFRPLMKFNPFWREPTLDQQVFYANAPSLIRYTDCGNGHYLQRIRRAFHLDVDDVPRGFMDWSGERHSNRVCLHFTPGPHAATQKRLVHPRARELYYDTARELEAFIAMRKDLRFFQIGCTTTSPLKGATSMSTDDESKLVDFIGSCSWFIGIMSGPLHVAVALNLKCIVVVNFPSAKEIVLPTLKVNGTVEEEWLYPQNVHLHQEDESLLVPKCTHLTLNQAFNGEIYPFWKTDYCNLIHDPIRGSSIGIGKALPFAPEDLILKWYRDQKPAPRKPLPSVPFTAVMQAAEGLGDTMMLTDIPRAAFDQSRVVSTWSMSPHFMPLMEFNPCWQPPANMNFSAGQWLHGPQYDPPVWKPKDPSVRVLNGPDVCRVWDCGNGHFLQRLRRGALGINSGGLRIDDRPAGCLACPSERKESRVILHFEPAKPNQEWQARYVHPRARILYPEFKTAIEKFIGTRKGYEFVSVGQSDPKIKGAEHQPTVDTTSLVKLIASASWFIGIMSGPLHIATALGLRCVVIVNFPDAEHFYLPTIKVTGQTEEEWMYPQNVHMHQDREGPLVKMPTCSNLNKAFDGKLYPFWSEKYLSLIHEKL